MKRMDVRKCDQDKDKILHAEEVDLNLDDLHKSDAQERGANKGDTEDTGSVVEISSDETSSDEELQELKKVCNLLPTVC